MSTLFGVNVPYLAGDYGHDLAENPRFPTWPCSFHPMGAYGPTIEAKRLGFGAIRVWLCENAEGLRVDSGRLVGVSERLLESVRVVQEGARLHGLRVYWTLLDGNAWPREGDDITRSILANADCAERFAEQVVGPLCRVLDPEVAVALDVVNEPESSTAACMQGRGGEPVAWEAIGRTIRLAGQAARAERDLWVTAGTGHVFLPSLWRSGAEIDAVDVHVYHPDGGLPSRADLAAYVEDERLLDPDLPLLGGELGIPKDPGPTSPTSPGSLENFIHNAERLGYTAAFLWQLEGDLIDKGRRGRPWTELGERISHALRRLRARAA